MQGSPWSRMDMPAGTKPPSINQPWVAYQPGAKTGTPGWRGSPPGNTLTPGYGVRGPTNPPGSPASYEMMSGMVLPNPQGASDGGDYSGVPRGTIPFDADRFIKSGGVTPEPEVLNPIPLFTGARGLNAESLSNYWNRWREYMNPMRGLTVAKVVRLIKEYQIGLWADYQWTLFWCLRRDSTLIHLMQRRVSAILSRRIEHQPIAEEDFPDGYSIEDAQAQCRTLRQQYGLIDNWREALAFLESAAVQGYAHLEKVRNAEGDITRLECVKQWHWCRKSWYSDWLYNAAAINTNNGEEVDLSRFVIRDETNNTFLGDATLTYYVRLGLCEKNWDAFIEIFGIPRPVVTGPDPRIMGGVGYSTNEFLASAQAIANGGIGSLPYGATVNYPNETRGNQPFQDRAEWLVTKITQMYTGSSLTSEAKSGSGTLAGNAHQDSWDEVCALEADVISELLNNQLSTDILLRYHSGEPRLCKTVLGTVEQQDSQKAVAEVIQLRTAGFKLDPDQVNERTGWKIIEDEEPDTATGKPQAAASKELSNRFGEVDNLLHTEQRFTAALWRDLQPRLKALWNNSKAAGDQSEQLKRFSAGLPGIIEHLEDPVAASVLCEGMMRGFSEGLHSLTPTP